LVDVLTALASTAAGALTGKASGASAAFNEVTGNFLPDEIYLNILQSCLNGNTCSDDESKRNMVMRAEEISKKLDQAMLSHCNADPTGNNCKNAVNAATRYISMNEAWQIMIKDISRSSHDLFEHLYNSPNAKERLAKYFEPATKELISTLRVTYTK